MTGRTDEAFAYLCDLCVGDDQATLPCDAAAELVEVAQRHRLLPLLGRTIVVGELEVPPFLDELAVMAWTVAQHRSTVAVRVAKTIAEGLRSAGIAFAFTKGVVLQAISYANDGTRWFADIDLMVAPEEAERTADALLELGLKPGWYYRSAGSVVPLDRHTMMLYRLSPDHLPHRVLLTDDVLVPAIYVDVAMSFTWARAPIELPVASAVERAKEVAVLPDGTTLPTLPLAEHFLFVVLHLFREAWFLRTSDKVRLSGFRDVAVTAAALDEHTRDQVTALIERQALAAQVGWILEHTDRVFASRTSLRDAIGVEAPTDDALCSVEAGGGDVMRWSGDMARRLSHGMDAA